MLAFRVAGVPVVVHPSFWLVALMLGSQSRSTAGALVWLVASFASVLLHELGHAFAARAFGLHAHVELHSMGGTTYPSGARGPLPTAQSVAISLAGPCAGLIAGALVYALDVGWLPPDASPVARMAVGDLLWINWGYGLLNFLPIVPLDGGHVMQSLVERARGKRSPALVAGISVAAAGALGAFALARQAWWALFMLGWLALAHVRTLRAWWDARGDAAVDPREAASVVRARLERGDLDGAARLALTAPAGALSHEAHYEVESRLFHAGRFDASARVARVAFERFGAPTDAYNAACAHARAGRDDEAMAWLACAVDAGYDDGRGLDDDEDLAALRGRADFVALRARIEPGARRAAT